MPCRANEKNQQNPIDPITIPNWSVKYADTQDIPRETRFQEDNKARRQDLERQQLPLNQIEVADEDNEQNNYSDEDINQGFQNRHNFHPLEMTRATLNSQTRLHSLDKRSKADEIYQRRCNHDVKAMRNSNHSDW